VESENASQLAACRGKVSVVGLEPAIPHAPLHFDDLRFATEQLTRAANMAIAKQLG
jgi:hypothetical protein